MRGIARHTWSITAPPDEKHWAWAWEAVVEEGAERRSAHESEDLPAALHQPGALARGVERREQTCRVFPDAAHTRMASRSNYVRSTTNVDDNLIGAGVP